MSDIPEDVITYHNPDIQQLFRLRNRRRHFPNQLRRLFDAIRDPAAAYENSD